MSIGEFVSAISIVLKPWAAPLPPDEDIDDDDVEEEFNASTV